MLTLSGCTKHFHNTLDSVKSAWELSSGPTIPTGYVESLPYASSLVSINDEHYILLILGSISINPENQSYRLTWYANDNGTITTENGRIVHTTGIGKNNLENILSINTVPATQAPYDQQATYDWSPGYRYDFSAHVHGQLLGTETLTTELWTQLTNHVQETVKFTALNSEFNNHYWITPETKDAKPFVVKSIQYLGPNMDKVEMIILKRFIEPKLDTTNKQSPKDSL